MFFVAQTRSIDLRSCTCRRTTYSSCMLTSDIHVCSVPKTFLCMVSLSKRMVSSGS